MKLIAAFLLTGLLSATCTANVMRVAIANEEKKDTSDPIFYFEKLVALAMEKTRATDGDYQIDYLGLNVSVERLKAILTANAGVDIIWASVSTERKNAMRVIPIDIMRNLNNYRMLLIRAEDQEFFSKISSINELAQYSMGDGTHWTDSRIMEANNFTVNTATDYASLIKMLAANRFYFIPRGLNDIYDDVTRYKQFKLSIENHLLLKYDRPIEYCFFVNKDNLLLAQRIEKGLRIAAADGSWDALFNQMTTLRLGMEELKNHHRLVLTLKNPVE